jgi:hypothetical protein
MGAGCEQGICEPGEELEQDYEREEEECYCYCVSAEYFDLGEIGDERTFCWRDVDVESIGPADWTGWCALGYEFAALGEVGCHFGGDA